MEIVGVMPDQFAFPTATVDLWTSFEWKADDRAQVWFRRAHWPRAIARLRPGVPISQADAELQNVAHQLQREYPETNRVMGAGMTPLHRFLVGKTRRPLLILLAAVSLLLVIACANVGNLLLVQAASRERETALRLALGAGRARVIRQAMAESLVLSAIGGGVGVALGWAGTRMLEVLQPEGLLQVTHFALDAHVLLYVLLITMASGLAFGIAPALWSGRRAPGDALKEGGRGSDSGGGRRWSESLVVAEVALAVLLTLRAGLLVRSFIRLQQVDAGFDPAGTLATQIALPEGTYDTPEKQLAFFDQVIERARELPGVTAVAYASAVPLTGGPWTSDFTIAGRPAGEYGTEVMHRKVSPEYFGTMRVSLLSGRLFTAEDGAKSPAVVLINEPLARQYFSGQNPVGQRITFDRTPDSSSVWRMVVGVVRGERQTDPAALAPAVRRIVADLDPNLALISIRTMREIRSAAAARDRFLTALMLLFAGVGAILAVVGVYGVMAQLAQRRSREMGIRMALGAQPSEVRWIVVRHGLRLIGIGLAGGLAVAAGTTRVLQALLYQIATADPATFVAVPLLLAVVGVIATWVPAAQASRVDPATTLRGD